MKSAFLFVLVVCCGAFCQPRRATNSYTYKKNEYVQIARGLAPNRRVALAAHGEGEDGYKNFHLYLMHEPGHRKIGTLPDIHQFLNTGADSYEAIWSPDSHFVAVIYNEARYIQTMRLYRLDKGCAVPVQGFDLEQAAVRQRGFARHPFADLREDEGYFWRLGYYAIKWRDDSHFDLKQEEFYLVPSLQPAAKMGAFIKSTKLPENSTNEYGVNFSMKAACQINTKNRTVQIVSLKPGKFTLGKP